MKLLYFELEINKWHEVIELSCLDNNSMLDDFRIIVAILENEPNIILY